MIFSHPILGRTFLLTGKERGGSLEVIFCLLWFVLWIKYFPFYKCLCFHWIHITEKIIYLENNIVWNYMHVSQWPCFKILVHNNNWPKVIGYGKDLCSYGPLWNHQRYSIPQTAVYKMSHKWLLTQDTCILCLTVHVVTLCGLLCGITTGSVPTVTHTHQNVCTPVCCKAFWIKSIPLKSHGHRTGLCGSVLDVITVQTAYLLSHRRAGSLSMNVQAPFDETEYLWRSVTQATPPEVHHI